MSKFFAFIYRMKYIARWSLMRNTRTENLAEHSFHVAVLAHALAVISRDVFKNKIDPNRAASAALYHDMSEILTGDLPTPVKYYGDEIKTAYKKIEKEADARLLSYVDDDMKAGISEAADCNDADVLRLVKAADKLDAYIKCFEERKSGNSDFVRAEAQTKSALLKLNCREADYFMSHCMDAFSLTLDELEGD